MFIEIVQYKFGNMVTMECLLLRCSKSVGHDFLHLKQNLLEIFSSKASIISF